MPLDPLLANPATIKFADPMEQYGNFLKNSYLQEEIAKARRGEADDTAYNKLMADNVKSDGTYDRNALKGAFALGGQGKQIPKLEEHFAKLDKTKAEVDQAAKKGVESEAHAGLFTAQKLKAKTETLLKDMGSISAVPETGLPQALDLLQQHYGDPDFKQSMVLAGRDPNTSYKNDADALVLAAKSGPDAWKQHLAQHSAELEKALAPVATHMTATGPGGKQQNIMLTDKFGGASRVAPGSVQGYDPKTPTVNVNNLPENKGLTAFNENMAKDAIKDYSEKRKSAESAQMSADSIERMEKLVDDGAFLGALSKPEEDVTNYAKALGFTVNDGQLIRSQELRKMLNKNVYDNVVALKAAGAPISRLTNVELKLVQDASPNMDMDPATIKILLGAQKKMLQNGVIMHNKRYRELTSNPKTADAMSLYGYHPIDIPGIPQAAIQKLKANPNKNPNIAAEFDKAFGLPPGTAADLVGGASNGGATFP